MHRDYTNFKPGPKPLKEYEICKHCGIKIDRRFTCCEECRKMVKRQQIAVIRNNTDKFLNQCRRAGKNSAAIQKTRSKDEIELYNFCKEHFESVRHNEQITNGWDADIIIDDNKTVILWNGPWHYRDMPGLKHSLKQVQNRDRIKIKELTSAGWNVLVFEDREYTPKTAFNELIAGSDSRTLGS